jgi:hypothetical protein
MDNLLEFIVPLVFAAIYFIGNMMSGKSDENDQPKPARGREKPEDAEAAARQRNIQEEIRRKIMERRQAAETPQRAEPVREMSASDQQQRERRRALEAERGQKEVAKKVTPPPVRRQAEPPTMVMKESDRGFNWDASDDIYDSKIEQQLQRIEATKRQAELLKKKVPVYGAKAKREKSSSSSRTFSGPIRSHLQDPAAARVAFIYGEVLGQPVSERKQSNVPGLS